MKKTILFSQAAFLLTFLTLLANNATKIGSTNGELQGTVSDSVTGSTISFATVVMFNDSGRIKGSCYSDTLGKFIIKDIKPGTYSVKVLFAGYSSKEIKNIPITAGSTTYMSFPIKRSGKELKELGAREEHISIPGQPSKEQVMAGKGLNKMPTDVNNVNNVVATSAKVYQSDAGSSIGLNGSRIYSNKYYVDGIPMTGTIGLPSSAIEQVQIVTGGTPARYENKDGGMVTKSPGLQEEKLIIPSPIPENISPSYDEYVEPFHPNEEYAPLIENEFKSVKDEPLSTFSVDVDDASYSNFRRYINAGLVPPKDAIRIEEFINNFHYNYPQPTDEHPFSVSMEQSVCPWNTTHQLVKIGIKGKSISLDSLPASNLVFLIDVSGSMDSPERLPLVKKCFELLIKQLRPIDKVAIVVYAGNAGLVLPPTGGKNKNAIYAALDNLSAGGSTAGGAGIELSYRIAKENFITGGNNRVILATDGDFNVGVSSESDLLQLIESKRGDKIFLTTLGFGQDNYKDAKMELLADKGNGNYSYIDNYEQGKKVFEQQLTATLFTIAKDVKLQVEFNPSIVKAYRLIGYEDRLLNKEDFNDDKKDAGEIGCGHTVTAFYEITPAGSKEQVPDVDTLKYQTVKTNSVFNTNEMLTLKLRYKKPDGDTSKLIVKVLKNEPKDIEACTEDFRFAAAVAEFSIVLRDSRFKGDATFKHAIALAKKSKGTDEDGSRAEFLKLAATAEKLSTCSQASSK